jgi:hypothetical protein
VPRHVARLIARLFVDYFASCRLIVDNFTYTARLGASACRAAHCAARCRLLRLCRTSGCLGTSRGSLSTTLPTPHVRVPRQVARLVVDYLPRAGSSSTTSPTPRVLVPRHIAQLVVDYFAYAVRPAASARRRLLRLA